MLQYNFEQVSLFNFLLKKIPQVNSPLAKTLSASNFAKSRG